jgi:hypothetical protein
MCSQPPLVGKNIECYIFFYPNAYNVPYVLFGVLKTSYPIPLMSAITIKQTKKDVKWAFKIINIGKIFMFYHLKPWQSWQVGPFPFIQMSRNSNQESI